MESKKEELTEIIDIITSYAQLSVYTLTNSATEITPKNLKSEIKMLYDKFGTKEVMRMANIIVKGKK